MSKILESHNHSRSFIRYHFIFSTKYRRKCFVNHEKELFDVFQRIGKRCGFKILHIGIDQDHVHLLVKAGPSLSIEQIVRRLKQMSTREMWKRHKEWLLPFYWGKRKHLWSSGYYCGTIGQISEETAIEYIKSQGK